MTTNRFRRGLSRVLVTTGLFACLAAAGCASGLEPVETPDPGPMFPPAGDNPFEGGSQSPPPSTTPPRSDNPAPPPVQATPDDNGDPSGLPDLIGHGNGGSSGPPPANNTSTQVAVGCPSAMTIDRFATAALTAGIQGSPARVQWQVVGAPDGADAVPSPADAVDSTFTPDLDGEYVLRFTAFDSQGGSASCDFNLYARFTGIRAVVTWDPGDFTIDVHMIDPQATAWFGARDCFEGACTADWGVSGDALDNPYVFSGDFDDGRRFSYIEVPRVAAAGGELYTVGFFVRPGGNGTVDQVTGQIVVQCGEDEAQGASFQTVREGDFVKGYDLRMRVGGGCDATLIGTGTTEAAARSAR